MQIARFMYDSPADIARKTYGIDRALTIVLASAHNAGGLIGSERNGIAILDDDHGYVVMERFAEGRDRDIQRKAFDRIGAMSWDELNDFIASVPNRGNAAPDIGTGSPPTRGDLVAQRRGGRNVDLSAGKDVRTARMREMDADPKCPYEFPQRTRAEIEAFLTSHPMHDTGNRYGAALAWNVKVQSFDSSGKDQGEKVDPALDKLWAANVEDDDQLFYRAAGDAMREYFDGDYTTFDADDHGDYEFHSAGRSGGWLILSKYKGKSVDFSDVIALREWVSDMSDDDLANAYKLVASVDHDTRDPGKAMAYQYAFLRNCQEETWKSDPAEAVAMALRQKVAAGDLAAAAKVLGMTDETLVAALKEHEADEDDAMEIAEAFGGAEAKALAEAAFEVAPTP